MLVDLGWGKEKGRHPVSLRHADATNTNKILDERSFAMLLSSEDLDSHVINAHTIQAWNDCKGICKGMSSTRKEAMKYARETYPSRVFYKITAHAQD